MATDFASLLSSDIVLIAAEGESQFFVHKDVLALQSAPFRETLSESTFNLIVNLQDWDHATVARLVEFLYRGSYLYPDPVAISPGNAAQGADSAAPGTESLTAVPRRNAIDDRERLNRFDPALYDYKEPLISHAKVYQLAQSGAIYPLRSLALRHLLDTLQRIDSGGSPTGHHTVAAICHLVRNVYGNNTYAPIDPPEFKEEGLQSHVSKFVARNFGALRSNTEMVQLMSEGGNIVIDVMGILSNGPSIIYPSVALPSVALSRPALNSGAVPCVVGPPVAPRSGTVPCVVLPPVAPRSGPVPRVLLPPVTSRARPVSSVGLRPVASRAPATLSVVLPAGAVTLPSLTLEINTPGTLVEHRFISQLMISDSPLRCPKFGTQTHDRVSALHGTGNVGIGNKSVWLYVGYTKFPAGACTSFTVDFQCAARGAVVIGPNCSIVPRRDLYVKRKIIGVTVARRSKVLTDITTYAGGGYDGMTNDLYSQGEHVYLIWKSVLVDPKNVSS